MKPSDLRKTVDHMIAEGTMPSLDKVLDAVHDIRKEYAPKILAARHESKDVKIPTKEHQDTSPAESMRDPETRFMAARHEAGHAVLNEILSPGSVTDTGIDEKGGTTNIKPPAGKTRASQLSRDELQNYLAGSMAGGLQEPGGTTRAHSRGDVEARSYVIGSRALAGKAGGDHMLEANQDLAAAHAKAQASMADPKTHKMIDSLAKQINLKGKLSGDEVRAHLKSIRFK
jgi:hypothetical protein